MTNLSAVIKRTNQKVHFEGVSRDNPNISIPFDFAPPIGDGHGFAGLELLLMTFSGCVSTALVFILGKAGKHIASYSASAEGIRREKPLSLEEIQFHISIESNDITKEDMEIAVKQAGMISPVWQAIKNNVAVKIDFELKPANA